MYNCRFINIWRHQFLWFKGIQLTVLKIILILNSWTDYTYTNLKLVDKIGLVIEIWLQKCYIWFFFWIDSNLTSTKIKKLVHSEYWWKHSIPVYLYMYHSYITILLPQNHLQSENIPYFTRFTGYNLHHINYTHYSTAWGSSWPNFNRFNLGWTNQNTLYKQKSS